jgi:hypothetical protein
MEGMEKKGRASSAMWEETGLTAIAPLQRQSYNGIIR